MSDHTQIPKNTEFLREAFSTEQDCLIPKLKSSSRISHAGDRGEVGSVPVVVKS